MESFPISVTQFFLCICKQPLLFSHVIANFVDFRLKEAISNAEIEFCYCFIVDILGLLLDEPNWRGR